jgi:hypothetical protein
MLSSSILLLSLWLTTTAVQSYPLIAQVPEGGERCFKFNIPEDDDAHMVFMALPMGEETGDGHDAALEGWLVNEVYEMTTKRTEQALPASLLNSAPEDVQKKMDAFIQKKGTNVSQLTVGISTDAINPASRVLSVKYFAPTVVNRVRDSHKRISNAAGDAADDVASSLSGFSVCFDNSKNEEQQVQVVMDIVMVSEPDPEEANEPNFVKEKHLSPLEESLEKSIKAANTVLREMKYMTDREERMRLTADSINTRVQYFSILSVVVLLAVTYVQVTYLKRYFKKKKLM